MDGAGRAVRSGANIILLSDGTGNSAASPFKTNVRRLYEALDLTDPKDPAQPRQFAFYDDGVGTSALRPVAAIGGAFGYGLKRNVLDLYANLCRIWQEGDSIYAFGFSRGAFTIRILNGLILNHGIIRYDGNEATFALKVEQAYRAYRSERYNPFYAHSGGRERGRRWPVALILADAWSAARGKQAGYDKSANRGMASGNCKLEVAFLGLWDTVDAYGLPIDELAIAVDTVFWPLTMADASLNARVKRACHALALDDERRTFHPRPWDESKEPARSAPDEDGRVSERITQVWFTGMHADVGGGYPDSGIAHVTLDWMVGHAEAQGLRFKKEMRNVQVALSDANGLLHDSRTGLQAYYRYMPRRVAALCHQRYTETGRPDVTIARPKIHESVFRRIMDGGDAYAPIGLPKTFDVVLLRDQPAKAGTEVFIDCDEFFGENSKPSGTEPSPLTEKRMEEQEAVWNWVWWRRVCYFTTLVATLCLLLMPLATSRADCVSASCVLTPLILGVGELLPGFVSPWITAYANNPQTTFVIAAIIGAGWWAGRRLETRLRDDMRSIWYNRVPELKPPHLLKIATPASTSLLNRLIQRTRLSDRYRATWMFAARFAMPLVAVLLVIYLLLGAVNIVLTGARESVGWACVAPEGRSGPGAFMPREECQFIGQVEHGNRYAVTVEVTEPWHDRGIPASPLGNSPSDMDSVFGILSPFRRHPGQPMFRLMLRIGSRGNTVLTPRWESDPANSEIFRAEFIAPRGGPVFLYVNDVAPFPVPAAFYDNNRGAARVSLILLGRGAPLNPPAPPPPAADPPRPAAPPASRE